MRTHKAPLFLAATGAAATLILAACGGEPEDANIPEFNPEDYPPVELTEEESTTCTDLRSMVVGLSDEMEDMESSSLLTIAERFESFADIVDDGAMEANAANLAEHFENAADDPSNYEVGSPNAVSVFNDAKTFADGCSEGWRNSND